MFSPQVPAHLIVQQNFEQNSIRTSEPTPLAGEGPTEDACLVAVEWILLSPRVGMFEPFTLMAGDLVRVGMTVGRVDETPVASSVDGTFIGMLAVTGER